MELIALIIIIIVVIIYRQSSKSIDEPTNKLVKTTPEKTHDEPQIDEPQIEPIDEPQIEPIDEPQIDPIDEPQIDPLITEVNQITIYKEKCFNGTGRTYKPGKKIILAYVDQDIIWLYKSFKITPGSHVKFISDTNSVNMIIQHDINDVEAWCDMHPQLVKSNKLADFDYHPFVNTVATITDFPPRHTNGIKPLFIELLPQQTILPKLLTFHSEYTFGSINNICNNSDFNSYIKLDTYEKNKMIAIGKSLARNSTTMFYRSIKVNQPCACKIVVVSFADIRVTKEFIFYQDIYRLDNLFTPNSENLSIFTTIYDDLMNIIPGSILMLVITDIL